jgi:hypothetical protein
VSTSMTPDPSVSRITSMQVSLVSLFLDANMIVFYLFDIFKLIDLSDISESIVSEELIYLCTNREVS